MPDFFDKLIADLVKGAEVNSRANGGPGVNIVVARENHGHEEKLANHAALGGLAGGLLLPGIGAPIGAALGADKGQGLSAAGGSILGGLGGGVAGGGIGALLGALAGNPQLGMGIGAGLGALPGMMYGAQKGGHKDTLGDKVKDKLGALEQRYANGVKAAAARLGIKEAIFGLEALGEALPALGRAFGAAKPALGRAGSFLMEHPIGQQVTSTAANSALNHMFAPRPPQPQGGMRPL